MLSYPKHEQVSKHIAIVTGATGEIGRCIAICLAQVGFHVVVCGRDKDRAERVCREIEALHGKAIFWIGNLTEPNFSKRLFDYVELELDESVTLLVNSAACNPKKAMPELDEKVFMETLHLNTIAPFFLIREMKYRLKSYQEAVAINIVSTAATQPLGQSHHYVASKAGLLGITKSLALELAPKVRVNAVSPGFVSTESHRKNSIKRIHQTPLQRLINPSEIADAVLFLTHQQGITGETITVDGGWSFNHE